MVSVSVTPKPTEESSGRKKVQTTNSIFVPYWDVSSLDENLANYNELFYFGVSVLDNGKINTNDAGYGNLSGFTEFAKKKIQGKEIWLVIRMLDADINSDILSDANKQELLINDVNGIAEKYSFAGIALDLETGTIINTAIEGQLNMFVQKLYTSEKQNYRKLNVLVYGDTFYRKRPYDIQYIGNHSDGIMIMAYDFHKSRGEPGPNFPLSGKDKYGYDLKVMTNDFLRYVPADKITVIFGMFGYDWAVDEKKRPIKPGEALSLKEITAQFITRCKWQNCTVTRDDQSAETEVDYVNSVVQDNYGFEDFHVVWFEDEQSVAAKESYLKTQGVGSFAFWTAGYF